MTARCDRPFNHARHTFIDGAGADHSCDGRVTTVTLAALLVERPELADVGTAARVASIGVAAA